MPRRYKIEHYPRAKTWTVETGQLVLAYHWSERRAQADKTHMIEDPAYAERLYRKALAAT